MDEITQQLQAKLDGLVSSAGDAAWASAARVTEGALGSAARASADAVTPLLHRGQARPSRAAVVVEGGRVSRRALSVGACAGGS